MSFYNLMICTNYYFFFFFQAEDGIRDKLVTGVQTCALPIFDPDRRGERSGSLKDCVSGLENLVDEVGALVRHEHTRGDGRHVIRVHCTCQYIRSFHTISGCRQRRRSTTPAPLGATECPE